MHPMKVCLAPQTIPSVTTSTEVGAAMDLNLRWAPRSRITIGFRAYRNQALQNVVMQWVQYLSGITGLTFQVVPVGDAQIRISFNDGGTNWSYIGRDCLNHPEPKPSRSPAMGAPKPPPPKPQDTMVLGIDGQDAAEQRGLVLHEFGHALGLIHEHQSPAAGIPWNLPVVFKWFKDTYSWDEKMVRENVIDVYKRTTLNYSAFDPQSIMIYGVPAALTTNQRGLPWNTTLSPTDELCLRYWYQNQ